MKRINNKEKGQTLIIAVLAIIVIFLAALFLFDLQSIIRVKVKAQTAADAAALAGAKMQVECLNLVGEINLIKASTMLVYDFSLGDDTPIALEAASDNLTEMQARISFVGPMLSVGAAQQAAKNNGMIPYSQADENFGMYISAVENDAIYGNEDDFEPIIEGYDWREPYVDMLRHIGNQGIAAWPSMEIPTMGGDWMDQSFYTAINTNYWCHRTLRRYLKNDGFFTGQWWQDLGENVNFIEESEFISLYVDFESGQGAYDELTPYAASFMGDRNLDLSDLYDTDEPEDTDGINSPIPYMRWCVYDGHWTSRIPGDHWVEGSSQLYLRRGLREEYQYGGAFSFFTCAATEATFLTGSYNIHNLSNNEGVITGTSEPTEAPSVTSTAAAKPLGYIDSVNQKLPPNTISMILPVFTGARLTPVTMPPANYGSTPDDYTLYMFIKWLEDIPDIDADITPPAGCSGYLAAIRRINDPEWRHSGWNPSFVYVPPDEVVLYDPETDTGAGFLQEPTGNPDVPGSDGYEWSLDSEGNPIERISINYDQEDLCDWVPPGGPGPGVGWGGGGPGKLH